MESPELMKAFLRWLGGGEESAGARKYEEIRRKLILFFRWRGCHVQEDLADETIDRTARAVLKPDFQYEGDPARYFRAVAGNVFLEWLRRQQRLPTDPISENDPGPPALSHTEEEENPRQDCLERCLNELHPDKKNLILRYYRNDKRAKIDERQRLADEQGIALNALRIQVFRIKSILRQCIEDCETERETL